VIENPSELALPRRRRSPFSRALRTEVRDVPRALEQPSWPRKTDLARPTWSSSASAASRVTRRGAPTRAIRPCGRASSSRHLPPRGALAWRPSTTPAPACGPNRTCARCHQVLFSRLSLYLGGRTSRPAESARERRAAVTSAPARRATSARRVQHRDELRRCHDPHAEDAPDKLAALAGPKGNELCAGCHADKRGDESLAGPLAPSSGRRGCRLPQLPHARREHGPRLSTDPLSSHRIADRSHAASKRSPARMRALPYRQTVGELVSTMERCGQALRPRPPHRALWRHEDIAAPATVLYGKAHEQAAALTYWARTGRRWGRMSGDISTVARELTNRYPSFATSRARRSAPSPDDLAR